MTEAVDPTVVANLAEGGIDLNALGHGFIRAKDASSLPHISPFHFRAWILRPGDTDLNLSHERSARMVVAALPTSIDAEEQLAMLLGRLVINHAALHHRLSELWSVLAGASPASRLIPDAFAQLIQDCRIMIPAVSALASPERARDAADALQFALGVNQRRNVMVHEMWISADAARLPAREPEDEVQQGPEFFRHKLPKRPKVSSAEATRTTAEPVTLHEVALTVCDTILAECRLRALTGLIDEGDRIADLGLLHWSDVAQRELLLGAYHGTVVDDWLRPQRD